LKHLIFTEPPPGLPQNGVAVLTFTGKDPEEILYENKFILLWNWPAFQEFVCLYSG